jgi:hypothetical protein
LDEGHFDKPPEVLGGFFKPRKDASGLFQPSDQPLHYVPPAICSAIEFHGAGPAVFVLLGGNDGSDLSIQQVFVNPIRAIPFVATQRYRPSYRFAFTVMQTCVGAFQHRIQRRGFVFLARSQMEMERMPMTITQQMNFRRKTPARTA